MARNPNRVSEGVAKRIAEQNPYTPEGVELIFNYMRDEGQIPAKYTTSKSYFNAVEKLVKDQGITPTRAATILYQRNFLRKSMDTAGDADLALRMAQASGYQGFPLKITSKGVSFNPRAIRDSIPKHLKAYFDNLAKQGILPPNAYQRYVDNVENHWTELGKELSQIRKDTGVVNHRGHTQSGKFGGPRGPRAVFRELGVDNMSHAETPRMLRYAAQELGIPYTWMEDAAYFILEEEGLSPTNVTPAMVNAVDSVKGEFRDPNEIIALRDQFEQQEAYAQQLAESRRVNPPPEFKPPQPAPGTQGRPQTFMSLVKKRGGTFAKAVYDATQTPVGKAATRLVVPGIVGLQTVTDEVGARELQAQYEADPTPSNRLKAGLGRSIQATNLAAVTGNPYAEAGAFVQELALTGLEILDAMPDVEGPIQGLDPEAAEQIPLQPTGVDGNLYNPLQPNL